MKKRTFMAGLLATTMMTAVPALAAEWDGPTSGPAAADGKSIVVVAGDLKNGGILGVTNRRRGSRGQDRLGRPRAGWRRLHSGPHGRHWSGA